MENLFRGIRKGPRSVTIHALQLAGEFAPSSLEPRSYEVRTGRIRAGRPFQPIAELEILPSLQTAAKKLAVASSNPLIYLPECPLPSGVPDMLVVAANSDDLDARLNCPAPALVAEQEVRIVTICGPTRGATLQQITRRTGLSESQAKRLVSRLVGSGALRKDSQRWFRDEAIAPFGRTYALEAKVGNWRSGMAQSLRYAGHADAAGLVLGQVSERVLNAAREAARLSSVGLFVADKWVVRPRISPLPLERRLLVGEHIVAALRTGTLSHPRNQD